MRLHNHFKVLIIRGWLLQKRMLFHLMSHVCMSSLQWVTIGDRVFQTSRILTIWPWLGKIRPRITKPVSLILLVGVVWIVTLRGIRVIWELWIVNWVRIILLAVVTILIFRCNVRIVNIIDFTFKRNVFYFQFSGSLKVRLFAQICLKIIRFLLFFIRIFLSNKIINFWTPLI